MIVTPSFFGTHVQGEWIADDGSLYQPVTKFFGLLRTWDGRVVWHKMERDATALEANIRFAQSRNAEVMFTFGEPPASAALPGYTKVPTMAAWESFIRQVVTESAGRIKLYEGPNEPAQLHYWDGLPEQLVELEMERYLLTKRLQKDAIIGSPAITEPGMARGIAFWDRYFALGGGAWCDEISYHAYAEKPEHLIGYDQALRSLLRKHGVTKPIRNTEYAIGSVDPSLRAAYQAQSYIICAALGYVGVVWNSHLDWAQDYTSDTTQRIADMILGASVGPIRKDGNTWRCTVSRVGQPDREISWSGDSFPVLGVASSSPPAPSVKGKRGCLLAFLPGVS